MISIIFEQSELEELWERLEVWQHNFEHGWGLEEYYVLKEQLEQLGETIDPDKYPVQVSDFPADVQRAIILFNKFGDRIQENVGYLGKDYTKLNLYMEVYEIENKKLFLEALLRLDSNIIKRSAAEIKAQRDKNERMLKR